MPEKVQTLGEFIDLISQTTTNVSGEAWIKFGQRGMSKEGWQEIKNLPLVPESVILFGRLISAHIREEAAHWSSEEPYHDTLEHGHAFLQEIHQKAMEQGIEVELERIDRPLTPTEMMAATGFIKVDEQGLVQLTEKGEEAAKAVESLIEDKNQ